MCFIGGEFVNEPRINIFIKGFTGFIHDRRYSTRYINNEEDCIILRDMLAEKIKYITELQKQKDFLGIISIEGDVESLIKERLNFEQAKAEVIKDTCELTIGSVKVTLKYIVPFPFKFDPLSISKIKLVAILDGYIKGYVSLDRDMFNKLYLKITG